jgi:hypothetical protein
MTWEKPLEDFEQKDNIFQVRVFKDHFEKRNVLIRILRL